MLASPVARRPKALPAILGLLAAAGCGSGASGPDGVIDDLPVLAPVEVLRIGSAEDPDTGFARPLALDVDRDGQVYVLDAQDLRIRVYSPEGRLLRTIGRRGEGPGEFERLPNFGVSGDTVWAADGIRVVRFTLFDRAGEVLSTARADAMLVPIHSASMWGLIRPGTFLPGGHFRADISGTAGGTTTGGPPDLYGPTDTILVPRLRYDAATGEIVDTVGWIPRPPPQTAEPRERITVGSTEYRLPPIPSDRPMVEPLPDGLLTVHRARALEPGTAEFRVTRTDMAGDTVFDRTFPYRPLPYDEGFLDEVAWDAVQLPRGMYRFVGGTPQIPPMPDDSMAAFQAIRPRLGFPDFRTPVDRIEVGDDGRVWLRRAALPGDTATWLVLETDGFPRAHVRLPRESRFLWTRADIVWMAEEDELGVPWVVRYRLRESGG